MTDQLKATRSQTMEDLSTVSEAELHQEDHGAKEAWQQMQELVRKIYQEKCEASKAIDDKYAEELASARENYAFLLTLVR